MSHSFAWWFGWAGAVSSAQMDGQIVFGGYDAAKTEGANHTQPLVAPTLSCTTGMTVLVTDMVLNFPNGTNAPMVSSGAIAACIMPDYPLIFTFPDTYYPAFEALSQTSNIGRGGGAGIGFSGPLYWPEEVYVPRRALLQRPVTDKGMQVSRGSDNHTG